MNSPLHAEDARAETSAPLTLQRQLVSALLESLRARHGGDGVQLIETHISFIVLAEGFAYKIKKALQLDFLDFSSLDKRHHFCAEELRLNRRLAPELYLEVVKITGSVGQPRLGGSGPAIEHALKMRAFSQQSLWDVLVGQGGLAAEHMDQVAAQLCALHDSAARSGSDTGFGRPGKVRAPMLDNLDALDSMLRLEDQRAIVGRLRRWEARQFELLEPVFERRQHDGRVRECHGDLHLGNLTMIDARPVMFDCLEFNESLRWTDVMSDVAFLAMDLQSHQRPDLAHRFLNAYFECSGDHDGARVLHYYMVHRALVRAKVGALRAAQSATATTGPMTAMLGRYLAVASDLGRSSRPVLLVSHGLSGSGKSSFTKYLIESLGAIRVRVDVERKRLHGLEAAQRSHSPLNEGLYSPQATEAVYRYLNQTARALLEGGFNVILDATFLRREQRRQAAALAVELGVKFVLLDFAASLATLQGRVLLRKAQGVDASEADLEVLKAQIASDEAVQPEEANAVFLFDAELPLDPGAVTAAWAPLVERLRTRA